MMTQYLMLILLWSGWCFLHSFMITPAVTGCLGKKLGGLFRYYRIFYNLTALTTLLPVVAYSFSLTGEPLFEWSGYRRILQVLLATASLWFFAAGAKKYDLSVLMGIRQARDGQRCGLLSDDCSLDTTGVLGMVRHPWYTGGMMIVWTRDQNTVSLITSLMITLYFIIGSFLEEKKLLADFGQAYEDYQKQVSMFLPFKWLSRKLGR